MFSLLKFILRASLAQVWSLEEVAHVLLPREGVINSYVVQVKILVFLCLCRSFPFRCLLQIVLIFPPLILAMCPLFEVRLSYSLITAKTPAFLCQTIHQADGGEITDFCSFYHLPSSIIGNDKHTKLNAVYSYYNVAKTMSMVDLMRDLLILAREEGTFLERWFCSL